jgi:hypothetical protein
MAAMIQYGAAAKEQKFFGSFFQKITLPLDVAP